VIFTRATFEHFAASAYALGRRGREPRLWLPGHAASKKLRAAKEWHARHEFLVDFDPAHRFEVEP
jgi:hypothetical protein